MSSKFGRQPLFDGVLTHPATKYIGLPVHDGKVGVWIGWLDATSSATITIELTALGAEDAPTETAGTYQWTGSGVSITGPAGSAAGSVIAKIDHAGAMRARVKVVTAATTTIKVFDGEL